VNILAFTAPLQLFRRISPFLPVALLPAYDLPVSTPLTQVTSSTLPSLRPDRPAVLVSSTSWTEDEDFSILLDALSIYEKRARAASGRLPHVLMFVTGKGPLLETYMRKARGLQDGEDGKEGPWQWVRIISTWLEPNDYPLLLGMWYTLSSPSYHDVE
jgi:beta-1,4-mannosyltransferase